MKYYVFIINDFNDETTSKKSIYVCDSHKEALATFHAEMGKALNNSKTEHIISLVINSEGGIIANEVH